MTNAQWQDEQNELDRQSRVLDGEQLHGTPRQVLSWITQEETFLALYTDITALHRSHCNCETGAR